MYFDQNDPQGEYEDPRSEGSYSSESEPEGLDYQDFEENEN
jgi:hypothetical protein